MAFGAALPAAFGPLLSLTGDAYEMGSLAVVHLPFWSGRRDLVGDDLAVKVAGGRAAFTNPACSPGVVVAALLGLLWASRLDAPRPERRDVAGRSAGGATGIERRLRGGIRLG